MKIIQISKHTKQELTKNIINILNKYEVIKNDNNYIIMNDNDAKSATEEILKCYNNITKTSKKGWGVIEFGEADMIDNPRYATIEYVDKKFDELSKRIDGLSDRIDALQNEMPNWFKVWSETVFMPTINKIHARMDQNDLKPYVEESN